MSKSSKRNITITRILTDMAWGVCADDGEEVHLNSRFLYLTPPIFEGENIVADLERTQGYSRASVKRILSRGVDLEQDEKTPMGQALLDEVGEVKQQLEDAHDYIAELEEENNDLRATKNKQADLIRQLQDDIAQSRVSVPAANSSSLSKHAPPRPDWRPKSVEWLVPDFDNKRRIIVGASLEKLGMSVYDLMSYRWPRESAEFSVHSAVLGTGSKNRISVSEWWARQGTNPDDYWKAQKKR